MEHEATPARDEPDAEDFDPTDPPTRTSEQLPEEAPEGVVSEHDDTDEEEVDE
jgi:hypothetical protein